MYERNKIELLRKRYPVGCRIRLQEMVDPYPIEPGTAGTLEFIDDAGQLHMKWDNGHSLALVADVDRFSVISDGEHIYKGAAM